MISTSDRDSNIASFIANKIKGKYAISSEESEIYRWDDSAGFWVQYGTQAKCLDQIAFEELSRHVGSEGFNTAKIGSVAGMLQYTLERIPVSDTSNIIFKNGVLDPSNGVFTPCSVKNIYARNSTGVDYIATDGSANFCPTFMDYINFISGSYDQTILPQRSTDRVRILKAILVMVLLRKYDWQLFVEIIGPGGTSKSTFAAMISLLVGQSSVKTIEAKDLEIPERRVDILNAALLYLPDMETYQGEGSGLKKITGGDPLSCRRLYGPSFSAHIRAIVLAVNNTPMRFTDHGGAISRRRVLLLLGQVVPIEKRDPNFISKLRREIPAIIQYLTAWIQEIGGINAVRKILTDATYGEDAKDILTDSDPMTGFAKDLHYANEVRCQVGGAPSSKHPSLPRMYLFHAYLKYCEFYNYETRITQRTFSSSFEVAAKRFGSVTRAKVNGKSIFKGVTIHDNANLQPEWM
jgi:putative DNA primase/helicase